MKVVQKWNLTSHPFPLGIGEYAIEKRCYFQFRMEIALLRE